MRKNKARARLDQTTGAWPAGRPSSAHNSGTCWAFLCKLVVVLVASHGLAFADSPGFLFVTQAGGTGTDLGIGITVDLADNVFVTGSFAGKANFDGISLMAAGSEDIFLAKYTSAGDIQWVKQAGGSVNGGITFERGDGIATDSEGNVYITGAFQGTSSFDDTTIVSAGNFDIFIAKYDTKGALQWVKQAGGRANDAGFGLATDRQDSVVVTGVFEGTANFDGIMLTSAGSVDVYVAKYSSSGELQWIQQISGKGRDFGFMIATDSENNVLVTGRFQGTASLAGTNLTSAGGDDIFIAKYSPSGDLVWVQQAGGTGGESGNAVAVDKAGNVFLTGQLGQQGYSLAKYDANGALVWEQQAFAEMRTRQPGESLTAFATVLDSEGSAIMTGGYRVAANFHGTRITPTGGRGERDIFVVKYDTNGVFQWVLQAGSTDSDGGESIAIDSQDNVYITGFVRGPAAFGPDIVTRHAGGDDLFVAKLRLR